MATRLCDLLIAAAALVPAAPLCVFAAAGIWLTEGRPVLHRSRRVGAGGRVFTMYKFRTMRLNAGPLTPTLSPQAGRGGADTLAPEGGEGRVRGMAGAGGAITAPADARVFPFGAFLRESKIDELPQLVNVLIGDMAIVGPRPEDPAIVDAWYGPLARETLTVRPGLASPGSLAAGRGRGRDLRACAAAAEAGARSRLRPRSVDRRRPPHHDARRDRHTRARPRPPHVSRSARNAPGTTPRG
jgi:lipopolysaccharide/colanic/teichoic acid biosynthesis glycosyltransferase